uniref:Uncharacterized protein n=1 Tax=Spermophilus dauricus TaxID=99837 RepID=A0A8C9URS5_SPEDA
MSRSSRAAQPWATFAPIWHLLNGKMQPSCKLAAIVSIKLQDSINCAPWTARLW